MDDPVSWFQIEPGWSVVSADGEPVGTVAQVAGSEQDDIFDGLAVKRGSSLAYVAAEQVGPIYLGRVTLKTTAAQTADLPPYTEAPPQQRLELPPEPLLTRFRRWLQR